MSFKLWFPKSVHMTGESTAEVLLWRSISLFIYSFNMERNGWWPLQNIVQYFNQQPYFKGSVFTDVIPVLWVLYSCQLHSPLNC